MSATDEFFVELGDFAGEEGWAVAEDFFGGGKRKGPAHFVPGPKFRAGPGLTASRT